MPDLCEHVTPVTLQEGDQVLVADEHVLLQDLDVGLGLAQRIYPAHHSPNFIRSFGTCNPSQLSSHWQSFI